MQPVRQDLALFRGDSRDLVVRLYARTSGSGRVPLEPEAGEAFEITITSALAGDLHTWSTAGTGADALQITIEDDATTLSKHLDAQTTKGIGGRGSLTWTLARIPADGERRTYLTGVVTMLAAPQGAPGLQAFDLIVDAAASVIEVVVTEAFSGAAALVGAAVAELRGGAPATTTLKTLSDAVGAREVAAAKGQPGGYAGLGSNGATPVAQGGTGGTTASAARTNLGLGSVATYAAAELPVSVAQGMADAGILAQALADPGVIAGRAAAPYIAGLSDIRRASNVSAIKGDGLSDDYTGLSALCAPAGVEIALKAGTTYLYRRTGSRDPLRLGPGSRLHGEGAKIRLDYADTSTNFQFVAAPGAYIEGVRFILSSGADFNFFLQMFEGTTLVDCTVEFEVQQGRYNGDHVCIQTAASAAGLGGSRVINLRTRGVAYPIRLATPDCSADGLDLQGWYKGIGLRGDRPTIRDLTSRGPAGDADGNPGYNLIGGCPDDTTIDGVILTSAAGAGSRSSGEHGIYLVGDTYTLPDGTTRNARGLTVRRYNAARTGQCGLKIKSVHAARVENAHVFDVPGTSAPGLNENGFHFDFCTDFLLTDSSASGYDRPGGYYSFWSNRSSGGVIKNCLFERPASHAVVWMSCEGMIGADLVLRDVPGAALCLQDSSEGANPFGGHSFSAVCERVAGPIFKSESAVDVTKAIRVSGTTDKASGLLWDSPSTRNVDVDVHAQSSRAVYPAARLWLNRSAGRVSSAKVRAVGDLLEYIAANGITLQRLHLLGSLDRPHDLADILDPRRGMAEVGTLTYSHLGYAGDGTSGYLRLDATPAAVCGTQDDAMVGVDVLTNVASDARVLGHDNTGEPSFLFTPRSAADKIEVRFNDEVTNQYASTDSTGAWLLRRIGTSKQVWKDGAQIPTGWAAVASKPSLTGKLTIGYNGGSATRYDTRQVGAFWSGAASGLPGALIPGFTSRLRAAVRALA